MRRYKAYSRDEIGLVMILEELKTIKSFGSQLESTITMEDIAAKEKKLKIRLAEALTDLYLTFHPEDPLFSGPCSLLPFEGLKVQRIKRANWHYVLLPFAWDETIQTTYLVGIEMKPSPKNEYSQDVYHYQEEADPPIFYIKDKDIKQMMDDEKASAFILRWVASHQVYAMPSILGVKQFSDEAWESLPRLHQELKRVRVSKAIPPAFLAVDGFCWRRPDGFAPVTTYNRDTKTIEPVVKHLIGARTDEPLEELLEYTGLEPHWQRSQKGHEVFSYKRPEKPEKPKPFRPEKERELISIAPVLDFLCKFASIDGPVIEPEKIDKAEERLGGALPLPLREYYQFMPKTCYRGLNMILAPGNLRLRKDGKITFLTENQQFYSCAVEKDSPFVFKREEDGEWVATGIADGYLAVEFAMNLGCVDKLNLEFETYKDFKTEMLQQGGVLYPHLHDIAGITDKIAEGNCTRLYQGMDGRLIAICACGTPTLYLIAKDTQTIQDFYTEANKS